MGKAFPIFRAESKGKRSLSCEKACGVSGIDHVPGGHGPLSKILSVGDVIFFFFIALYHLQSYLT